MNTVDDAGLFRRYLLGRLDDSELEAFEEKLMTSDEHFEELLIAEDELIDDYCAGELDADEARAYREHFLVTRDRERQHRFGAALRKHVSASEPVVVPSTGGELADSSFRWWKLIAAAVLVAVAFWLIPDNGRAPFQLEQTVGPIEGRSMALFLPRGSFRSLQPERPTLKIDGLDTVELQLELPDDARDEYEVVLSDANSNVVVAQGTLAVEVDEGDRIIVAAVPAAILVPGDYRVVLRADGEDAALETFGFRVTRE